MKAILEIIAINLAYILGSGFILLAGWRIWVKENAGSKSKLEEIEKQLKVVKEQSEESKNRIRSQEIEIENLQKCEKRISEIEKDADLRYEEMFRMSIAMEYMKKTIEGNTSVK